MSASYKGSFAPYLCLRREVHLEFIESEKFQIDSYTTYGYITFYFTLILIPVLEQGEVKNGL